MLTEYKDVRPQKGLKSPLKNVFMRIQKFFQGIEGMETSKFDILLSLVFFGKII